MYVAWKYISIIMHRNFSSYNSDSITLKKKGSSNITEIYLFDFLCIGAYMYKYEVMLIFHLVGKSKIFLKFSSHPTPFRKLNTPASC